MTPTSDPLRHRIFKSDLTGRYYYCARSKDLGNGNFQVVGQKFDVTADIEAIIDAFLKEGEEVTPSKPPPEPRSYADIDDGDESP